MGIFFLIAALGCFVPLIVSMARCFIRTPEAISTPAWLLAANALFILGGPVFVFLCFGEDLTGSSRGAAKVAAVLVAYSAVTFVSYWAFARLANALNLSSFPVLSAVATLKKAADVIKPWEVFVWSIIVFAIQITAFSLYSLGLSGGTMAYDYKVNIPYGLLALYMLLGEATLGLAALLARIAFGHGKVNTRLFAGLLLLVEFGITVLSGRRELIWLTLAVTFGIIWSGRRKWVGALPFSVGFVYLVLFVFGPVFLRARVLYSGGNAPSVVDSYRIALGERADEVTGKADFDAQKNMSWRFRTYVFWEELYEDRGGGFTEGKIIAQAALMMLPRLIFGFSKYGLGVVDENLLEVKFDICNNVSLESYIDIGVFGPVAYGVIFGAVFALSDGLIMWAGSRYRIMGVLAAGVMLRHLFGPEANPIAYLSILRSCLIYAILASLIAILWGRKSLDPSIATRANSSLAKPRPAMALTAIPASGWRL
ncbi:MAG: hypothetical protein SH850_26985 [Planctomycetaceae bacterium]|nr:hypothetical protein [Planctomycetaceae bacterium]